MRSVPRLGFVPDSLRAFAWENRALSIGHGQTISQPYIVGLMTQSLDLHPTDRVLEIGTGSGYQAAVLSRLAKHVYTVELIAELSLSARSRLEELGCRNVSFRIGDGSLGWTEEAPFEAVLVTACAPAMPPRLFEQLAPGGRIVYPRGDDREQELILARKTASGQAKETFLCRCAFVPLVAGGRT
jgi:protein-L-isoaspartate(D-aspartate) O-methyltransferase